MLQVSEKNVSFVLLNFVIFSSFCNLICYIDSNIAAWPTLREKSIVLNNICYPVISLSCCFSVVLLWGMQLRRFRNCGRKYLMSLNLFERLRYLLFNEISFRLCKKLEKILCLALFLDCPQKNPW